MATKYVRRVKTEAERLAYNAYMREYNLKRYYRKREEAIAYLGGKCAMCDSVANLEFDHKDPSKRSFHISENWAISSEKFKKELDKCQLLCQNCHNEKSIGERGMKVTKDQNIHGTLSSYDYCKCEICRLAMWEYNQKRPKPE